jgi:hypothetical protein
MWKGWQMEFAGVDLKMNLEKLKLKALIASCLSAENAVNGDDSSQL